MKTLCIINHKGGTGKTTSTINIGAGLARKGSKVLLIDADPQANMTESLGIMSPDKTIYDALSNSQLLPIIKVGNRFNIVPSSLDLAGIELELAAKIARETYLRKLIEKVKDVFDYCLIDCPPSLGILTINGLVAADSVYIPLEAEFLAYRGINSMIGIINSVKEHFNPHLTIGGVFITRYNPNRVLTKSIQNNIKDYFRDKLMKTTIRVNVSLPESQANGKDIFDYAPNSNGAADYMILVNEILETIP